MPDNLTFRQVSERLGVSTRTLHRWRLRGAMPAIRIGGRWYVSADWVETSAQYGTPRKIALASIDLDCQPPRRGTIWYQDGRLSCDGNDITPVAGKIDIDQAIESIEQMYGERYTAFSGVWGLRWTAFSESRM